MQSWVEYAQALAVPHAIIGVGVPGSGKTRLLFPFAKERAYEYVNLDVVRKDITGDASDLSQDEWVVHLANLRMSQALLAGRSVVFDATNTNNERRESLVATLRQEGAKTVIAVWVDVSLQQALDGVESRGRAVPDEGKFKADIARMHERLAKHPPVIAEGFDRIFVVTR